MSDRVLLEKAAKAAGYNVEFSQDGLGCWFKGKTTSWRPLFSDGDALRLAVKLKIPLQFPDWKEVARTWGAEDSGETYDEPAFDHGGDLGSATRRAIVRAAAALADAGDQQ